MSEAWKGGSTRAWRRTRAQVLARDGRRCQLHVAGVCTTIATEVHHVLGRDVSGDDPAHLASSCKPCNGHVGDPRRHDPDPTPRAWWDEPA